MEGGASKEGEASSELSSECNQTKQNTHTQKIFTCGHLPFFWFV